MTDQGKKYADNSIEIRITFGNGMSLFSNRENNSQTALCYRILYSYLDMSCRYNDFGTFFQDFKVDNLLLIDTLDNIARHWRRFNNKPSDYPVAIYLAVDEFTNCAGLEFSEKEGKMKDVSLSNILNAIGSFINNKNTTPNSNLKLFPLFAGLDFSIFSLNASFSTYGSFYISPYRYTDEDELSIVKHNVPTALQHTSELWKTLALIDKHPRMLEWFISALTSRNDITAIEKAYLEASQTFSSYYAKSEIQKKEAFDILAYYITGIPIPSKKEEPVDSYFKSLEDRGYIRLHYSDSQIYLSTVLPIIFKCTQYLRDQREDQTLFRNFFLKLQHHTFHPRTHDADFEEFNAMFDIILNKSFLMLGKNQLTINERFKGLKMNQPELGEKLIDLKTFPTSIMKEQYSFQNKDAVYIIPNQHMIHKTLFKRAQFFDRFCRTDIDGEKWTILWQDKGTHSDYEYFAQNAITKVNNDQFTTEKIAQIGGTIEKSLAIIVTTKPLSTTAEIPKQFGIIDREGLMQYYGHVIFRSYLFNIAKPFKVNQPNTYTPYELAIFFGIPSKTAKRLIKEIKSGKLVTQEILLERYNISPTDDISFE